MVVELRAEIRQGSALGYKGWRKRSSFGLGFLSYSSPECRYEQLECVVRVSIIT